MMHNFFWVRIGLGLWACPSCWRCPCLTNFLAGFFQSYEEGLRKLKLRWSEGVQIQCDVLIDSGCYMSKLLKVIAEEQISLHPMYRFVHEFKAVPISAKTPCFEELATFVQCLNKSHAFAPECQKRYKELIECMKKHDFLKWEIDGTSSSKYISDSSEPAVRAHWSRRASFFFERVKSTGSAQEGPMRMQIVPKDFKVGHVWNNPDANVLWCNRKMYIGCCSRW